MANSAVGQHKRLAMGAGTKQVKDLAKGGSAGLKTGIPDNPITVAKRNNGVPGMKKGGSQKC